MSINPDPVLNQPVDITVTVSSPRVNVSNITLELFIPVGFELISDNSKWRGDMQKGETRNLEVKVKAIHAGNWAIQFLATSDLPSESTFLETKFLYVSISETEAKVSDIPMVGINYIGTARKESLKTTNEELLN